LADLKLLAQKATQTRIAILNMIYQGKGGHIGGALSCTDILVALYYAVMRIDPKHPNWESRDRFVLSKGHSVEGLYAILADLGFISETELGSYRGFHSRLIGHPTNNVPGIEVNTGALGHGLSVGVGMALAGKMDRKDYKVYALMGDGELAEGSVWEAAMAGSHYKLDNLIGIVDRNRLQIGGNTEDVMALEDLKAKWQAFGWEVLDGDGHDFQTLVGMLARIPVVSGKPHVIIANTIKGKGISFMENQSGWHHRVPNDREYAEALHELELRMGAV